MIRVTYSVVVDRPHSARQPSTLEDSFTCEFPGQVLAGLAEAAGTIGFFSERVIASDAHECGTGLNGAHCAGCGSDYCTVCGHKCTMQ